MHIGHYISGGAHAGVIIWALFGGIFRPAPEPLEISTVDIISVEEFEALSKTVQAPEITDQLAALPTPQAPETPPSQPTPTSEVPRPPARPTPAPQLPSAVPDAPVAETPPAPKPIERVAEVPRPAPAPEDKPADKTQQSVALSEQSTQSPQDQQEATAEQEAAQEIVPETVDKPSGTITQSRRPKQRPEALASRETPQPEPEQQPDPKPEPEPQAKPQDDAPSVDQNSVQDALQAVLGETVSETPSGPPLTFAEREGFRVSVQSCWNVDTGNRWARVIVTVGLTLDQDGKVASEPRLIAAQGGDESEVQAAFQAARRAIYLCQKNGYDLPVAKYDQWREIEITFNPEKMRTR